MKNYNKVENLPLMYIPIILGTARKGRQSKKVANFIFQEVKKTELKSEIIDVRHFKITTTDKSKKLPQAKKLIEKISKADGLIIVVPEYNHGYPGELKLMMDMLYEEYTRKPVGICGVSAGIFGGTRAVEQLRLVLIEFQMVPIREALYFPLVHNLFDEKGNIQDKSYKERVKKFLEELIWYVKTLKMTREKFK